MALKANANLTFLRYTVENDGTHLWFLCADPGPGEDTDYMIVLTDDDLATVTTQLQLKNLVLGKFARKIRAQNIASKLDGFLGQNITVP